MLLPLFVGVLCLLLVLLFTTLCPSRFAIILMWKRGLVALLWLSSWCLVTVSVLWPRAGLECMVVVFPDHTH